MLVLGLIKSHVLYPFAEFCEGRKIQEKLDQLRKYQQLSANEKKQHRLERLITTLSVAREQVPYYRELFQQVEFDPESLREDLKNFEKIPFLTKDIIKEQGKRLLNQSIMNKKIHRRKTGGSTGICTFISYGQDALDWTAAANRLVIENFAKRPLHKKEVHLSTNFFSADSFKAKVIEYLKCQAMNRYNVYTHALDDSSLKETWEKIFAIGPDIIQGHPSTVYALANFIERNNLQGKRLCRAFESTGETLDGKKLAVIERNLGCKVFNRFGNAEFGVIAHSEDDPFKLVVLDFMVYAENLPLDVGGKEIVLTGLTNPLMPLIRYRTGDLGTIEELNDVIYLSKIQGRMHELVTIDGKNYPTHFLQDVLDRVAHVDEFQIIERKDNVPLLKVVLANKSHSARVLNKMGEMFGAQIEVEFTNFAGLVRVGWRDKFRYVIKG